MIPTLKLIFNSISSELFFQFLCHFSVISSPATCCCPCCLNFNSFSFCLENRSGQVFSQGFHLLPKTWFFYLKAWCAIPSHPLSMELLFQLVPISSATIFSPALLSLCSFSYPNFSYFYLTSIRFYQQMNGLFTSVTLCTVTFIVFLLKFGQILFSVLVLLLGFENCISTARIFHR